MTKPPRKKPAKARSIVAALPRQSSAIAEGDDFAALVERVMTIIDEPRSQVVRTVNSEMVLSCWHVGREIVEPVQRGAPPAEYGEQVIEALSVRLQARAGKDYSTTNSRYFRVFYLRCRGRHPEIRQTLSGYSALTPICRRRRTPSPASAKKGAS